jgi:hypothetical protein
MQSLVQCASGEWTDAPVLQLPAHLSQAEGQGSSEPGSQAGPRTRLRSCLAGGILFARVMVELVGEYRVGAWGFGHTYPAPGG